VEWLLEACDSLVVYRSRYVAAPRLAPTLDLLIRDTEHPRALSFHCEAISRDLTSLAASLGTESVEIFDGIVPSLADEALFALERDAPEAALARESLAAQLGEFSASAGRLSDRLSMRHFSHTGDAAYALAT
jgi:uncharacterized alpha-E superfamily protein